MNVARFRSLIILIAIMTTASMVAGASEIEGPNHQDEVHHCAVCCVNHNTAVPVSEVRVLPVIVAANQSSIEPNRLISQTVIRLLVPPPKFLA
jgi:hypothetical protein